MSWCCPPRPCVVFNASMHLALFLALSLFFQATRLFLHGMTSCARLNLHVTLFPKKMHFRELQKKLRAVPHFCPLGMSMIIISAIHLS